MTCEFTSTPIRGRRVAVGGLSHLPFQFFPIPSFRHLIGVPMYPQPILRYYLKCSHIPNITAQKVNTFGTKYLCHLCSPMFPFYAHALFSNFCDFLQHSSKVIFKIYLKKLIIQFFPSCLSQWATIHNNFKSFIHNEIT